MAPSPSSKPGSPTPERDGHQLARLARDVIAEGLGGPPCRPVDDPGDLGASFVTLTLDGELRGCVGSLVPHRSLVADLMDHARAAAFHDHRFEPLQPEELSRLGVEVSLLSPLHPLACTDETGLLEQLRPGLDGLLLEYEGRNVTFLPQVWEGLPDPEAFLHALKRKAGWPAGFWSPGIRAWTYTVEAWRDDPRPAPPSAAELAGPEGSGFLYPARHWHRLADGRLRCDVCPHGCALREGQAGRCAVRRREGNRLVLAAYGCASGFAVDPIEKKPLHHFLPGSRILSFGAVGCNLACRFCQNWDLSRSRDLGRLAERATPEEVAAAARRLGCRSVAFTYNEPVIALEYVSDVAGACRAEGIAAVAVTAGYIEDAARRDFFANLNAANVDLKAFNEDFYRRMAGGSLRPVLDTLRYLIHETEVWTEITTLLIPGLNDSDGEIRQLSRWVVTELGPDVPLHFSAFHPDHRMLDRPPTPLATLRRARVLAREAGLRYVYTGNLRDPEGEATPCPGCGSAVIRRDGYRLVAWHLDAEGRCSRCGARLPGRFGAGPPFLLAPGQGTRMNAV